MVPSAAGRSPSQKANEGKHIWHLIPISWRMWWLDYIKTVTRLATPILATSTDPRYCIFGYEMMTHLNSNHEETRVILKNRGLPVGDNKTGGLGWG